MLMYNSSGWPGLPAVISSSRWGVRQSSAVNTEDLL